MIDLKNKNIIVTGASGGIGNSIVDRLNEYGANILASGTKKEKLEELKKNLKILRFYNLIFQTLIKLKSLLKILLKN